MKLVKKELLFLIIVTFIFLLYTVFYRLMPELLRQGKVYIAETPLFEIELGGKEKSIFAYTVEEKNKILKDLEKKGKKFKKINRSKGLGENTPDMLWETTMCPQTRKLVKLDITVISVNQGQRIESEIIFPRGRSMLYL